MFIVGHQKAPVSRRHTASTGLAVRKNIFGTGKGIQKLDTLNGVE